MTGMITPTRGGQPIQPQQYAVGIPQQQQIPQVGVGQQPQGGVASYNQQLMMQQSGAAVNLINMFSQGTSAGGNGGINWNEVETQQQIAQDPILNSMQPKEPNQETWRNFINQSLQYIQNYLIQFANSNGQMYECTNSSIASFRVDQRGNTSLLRETFTKKIMSNNTLRIRIVQTAGIMLGSYMIVGFDQGRVKDTTFVLGAIETAIRNTMMMEMIGWMNGTTEGQGYSHNLPADVADNISRLDDLKNHFSEHYKHYGIPSPYDGLTFKVKTFTTGIPTHLSMGSEYTMDNAFNGYELRNASSQPTQGLNELQLMQRELERRYRSGEMSSVIAKDYSVAPPVVDRYTVENSFDNRRDDLQNLTKENQALFDLRQYFKPIIGYTKGDPNIPWYVIKQSEWRFIKRISTPRFPGRELTWTNGEQTRIVQIDLNDISGTKYDSSIVSHEGISYMETFTDPARILPILRANEEGQAVVVATASTSEITTINKVESEDKIYDIRQRVAENQVNVITFEEEINSNNSRKFEELTEWAGTRLVANSKELAAAGVRGTINDSYTVNDPSLKEDLIDLVPELYTENKAWTYISWFDMVTELKRKMGRVDNKEFATFINQRLTQNLNDWLINVGGFSKDPKEAGHFSCTDIFDDLKEVMELLHVQSPRCFEMLTTIGGCSLVRDIAMFNKGSVEGSDRVEQAKNDLEEIKISRTIDFVVFNEIPGLEENQTGDALAIYRSNLTGVFTAVEKLVENAKAYDRTDPIVVTCLKTGKRYAWNYSAYDTNVAYLRELRPNNLYVFLTYS